MDDAGVGIGGVGLNLVSRRVVEVAELVNLEKNMSSCPGDGFFLEFAGLQEIPEVDARIFAGAEVGKITRRRLRLFRQIYAEKSFEQGVIRFLVGWRFRLFGIEKRKQQGTEGAVFGTGAGHLHVEAVADERSGMRGSPVGGDETLKAEFVAENLDEHVGISAGVGAIHLVVGAHDGSDVGIDGVDEGGDIDFVESLRVDDDVGAIGVVGDVVLGLRHDVLTLNAFDQACAHDAGQDRIFSIRVVATLEGDIAIDVDKGLEDDVDAEGLGFAADDDAVVLRVFGAEGGGETHRGSLGLRGETGEYAGRAVGHAKRRNAEAGDSGEVSGLALIGDGIFVGAADESHFFFEGHLAEELVDAGVAGDRGDGLRRGKVCREGKEKDDCENLNHGGGEIPTD